MPPAPEGAAPLRLGIFGGTFDPPHVGHVAVARDVADALHLDRVLWIPARLPPHKDAAGVTPAAIRLEMAEVAAGEDPRFAVSDLEMLRDGPSYTVDTLRALAEGFPGSQLFLIVGSDQLRTFEHGWREPREILRLATLVLLDRGGEAADEVAPDLPGMERSLHFPVTRVDVSSSEIRSRVAAGQGVDGLVLPWVQLIMEREGLYGCAPRSKG